MSPWPCGLAINVIKIGLENPPNGSLLRQFEFATAAFSTFARLRWGGALRAEMIKACEQLGGARAADTADRSIGRREEVQNTEPTLRPTNETGREIVRAPA